MQRKKHWEDTMNLEACMKLGGLFALAMLGATALPAGAETLLAHDVYFTLHDNSAAARAKLVAACKRYLSGHEGTVYFSAGTLAPELARSVNDRDFDVALHVHFKDRAAHDKYQEHPRHKQFIEEEQGNWKKVRVFDSLVETAR
jgi:hypothetical protein